MHNRGLAAFLGGARVNRSYLDRVLENNLPLAREP